MCVRACIHRANIRMRVCMCVCVCVCVCAMQGDACNLPESLGQFDAVLAANLLCRLPDPMQFIDRLQTLVSVRHLCEGLYHMCVCVCVCVTHDTAVAGRGCK